ncbi:MAG: hypothetical protein QOG13_2809 [Sphingomonadales bacterium]|jgi:DNA-binding NtrC family response regulator|nr:hypothetical protein [Sphingomonadales bacterium]
MFGEKAILIVEDDAYAALDLSMAVEELDGRVVGPVGTVAEALAILESQEIAAAILDVELADRNVTPVVTLLAEKGVPFVVHTGTGLPFDLAELHPSVTVLRKPTKPTVVLALLLNRMDAAGR